MPNLQKLKLSILLGFFSFLYGLSVTPVLAISNKGQLPNLDGIFFGPKTTTSAQISDWSKVEHFTLDTDWNFTLVANQPLNFTDPNTEKAIAATIQDWKVTRWDLAIPESWWNKYSWRTPFTVTLHNPRLTTFAPQLINSRGSTTEIPTITTSSTGELQFVVDKPLDITVIPKIEIAGGATLETHQNTLAMEAKTSHRDISLSILNTTTKERRVTPITDIQADGSFSFTLYDLQRGLNEIEIYQGRMGKFRLVKKLQVEYTPTKIVLFKEWLNQKTLPLRSKLGMVKQKPTIVGTKPTDQTYEYPSDTSKPWLIAAGAILSTQNREGFDSLKVAIPASIVKTQLLKEWWGITDQASAREVLQWLELAGHSEQFSDIHTQIILNTQGDKDAYAEFREVAPPESNMIAQTVFDYDLVYAHRDELAEKSLTAWDLGRLINVARWSYTVGFISEDEAWYYLMLAGQRLQKTYTSWQDFSDNYVLGRTFWIHSTQHPETQASINYLLSQNPASPWNKIPWDQKLEKNDQKSMALSQNVAFVDSLQPSIRKIAPADASPDCAQFTNSTDPVAVKINLGFAKDANKAKTWVGLRPLRICPEESGPVKHLLEPSETSWTSPELKPGRYVLVVGHGNYESLITRTIDLVKGSTEVTFAIP